MKTNPLTDPTHPPRRGYVALRCTAHRRFIAWVWKAAPGAPVACPASCKAAPR